MNLGKWIGLFALLASLYILWQIRQLLLLVFTAVVIATALNRAVRWMTKKSSIPRSLAVLISIAFFILILIGFFLIIVPPLIDQFEQLATIVPRGINRLNEWIDFLERRLPGQLLQELPPIDINEVIQQLQPLVNQLVGGAGAFVGTTLGVGLSMLLMMVLTIMMLADPLAYRGAFIHLFPSFYRRRVDGILDKCEKALGGWVIGITINMSAIALLSWIALLILGIPLAPSQAVLAGLLAFIPNLGPALSVIPPMAIALLDSPGKSVLVLITYIVIQQVESNFLTPYVMAKQVSLLPAVTLMAQVFFAKFLGFLGLLLALPLTVVGQVWVKEVLIKDILDRWKSGNGDVISESASVSLESFEDVQLLDRCEVPELPQTTEAVNNIEDEAPETENNS